MDALALILVVAAAFIHATWNFLSKKSAAGPHFVWCYSLFSALIYLPLAWALLADSGFDYTALQWAIIASSGALHLGYAVILQRGYQLAELTVVYPVARGTGPLLASAGAFLLLGETPTAFGISGLLLVVTGILTIGGADRLMRGGNFSTGMTYGAATGLFIAAYTLVDAYGVKAALIHPLLLDYFSNLARLGMLLPATVRNRAVVLGLLRTQWRYAAAVGLLAPLSYILVLFAVQRAPVSVIAPARELSMIVAALLGARLLAEEDVLRRFLGAALIVAGVTALAIAPHP